MTISKSNVIIKLEENEIETLKKAYSILTTISKNQKKYYYTKANCAVIENIYDAITDITEYTSFEDNIDENTFICSNDFE